MGIHFVCHHCSYALHVKDYQAGKRGKCPNCRGSFRIPANDSSYSAPVEDVSENSSRDNLRSAFEQLNQKASSKHEASVSDSVAIAIEPNSIADVLPKESKKQSVNSSISKDAAATKKVPKASPVLNEVAEDDSTKPNLTMPPALIESSEAKWFVRPPSGGQFGPASSQLLMTWVTESRVTAESYLWREGFTNWQLAYELVPELFSTAKEPLSAAGAEPPSLTDILTGDSSSLQPNPDLKLDADIARRSGLLVKKQMRKRRQQLTMIVILAFISLVLFGILIFVLVFQATKSPGANAMHLVMPLVKRPKM